MLYDEENERYNARAPEGTLAKVVVRKLEPKAGRRTAASSVGKKRVRQIGGGSLTIRTIDAGSDTFTSDLSDVFRMNVAKARRENKLVVGKPDIVPAKD
jgi:hypothetical protein